MPIATPKTKSDIPTAPYMPELGPWSIRWDNQLGLPKSGERPVLAEPKPLDMVILGWSTWSGSIPPINQLDQLQKFVSDDLAELNMSAQGLSLEELVCHWANKSIKPWTVVTYIALPTQLDEYKVEPSDWPRYAVTNSLAHGLGTYRDDTGLFGSQGYFARLEAANLAPSQVITTCEWVKKSKGQRSWFTQEFTFAEIDPKKDPEIGKFIKACQKFIETWTAENPEADSFPLPPVTSNFVPLSPLEFMSQGDDFEQAKQFIALKTAELIKPDNVTVDPQKILSGITPQLSTTEEQGQLAAAIDVQAI